MRGLIAALVLGCTMLIAPIVHAEDPPSEPVSAGSDTPKDAAEERAAQFVGVHGPDAESVPGGALLLAAYAIVWALLFLFLMRIRGLQRHTAEELERLSAEIRATGSQ
jgi:CcmD family protein